jgi:hypothetical protein
MPGLLAPNGAGMGVQSILLMGVDFGVALLTMRQPGLWKRLRTAPLSRAQLLGSRMTSCALIGSGVFVVIFAVAIAAFGVRVQGSVAGLLLVMLGGFRDLVRGRGAGALPLGRLRTCSGAGLLP